MYQYNRYSPGLGGFGTVTPSIVADIGFDEQWSADDWRKNQWGGGTVKYTPIAYATIEAAQAQWTKLQDLIDQGAPSAAKAQARLATLRNNLADRIATIDTITRSGCDYANGQLNCTQTRIANFNSINGYLYGFANESWPDAQAEIDAAQAQADAVAAQAKAAADALTAAKAQAQADAATAKAKLQQTQDAIAAAQAAISHAAQAKAVADASATAHKQAASVAVQKHAATVAAVSSAAPMLIIGLVGAVGLAVFLARRGKSSVAGYRRRRRQR